jgi:peroxiredoxin
MTLTRRGLLAAGTVATVLGARKPHPAGAAEIGTLLPVATPGPAPDVAFQTADGAARRLADYVGKPLVVNLWATWCPPCVKELPTLAALAHSLAEDGILILPISSDRGGAKTVTAFYAAHGIDGLPVLIDKDSALLHAFGVQGLPTTFVIDRTGKVVGVEQGGMDWSAPGVVETVRRLAG